MWILPTRGRPKSLARFIQAWTATGSTTSVMVRLDDDDTSLAECRELAQSAKFICNIGPRRGLSKSMDEVFQIYPNEQWYGLLADDLVPQTTGWDTQLINSAGTFNISYPNDLGQAPDLPTHPCVGGDLVRALGWFGFPATYHYFVDTIWQYLGNELKNIHRLDNVIVEHLHHSVGKSTIDQTYIESTEKWRQDKRAYRDWIDQNGKQTVEKLSEIYKR